MYGRAPRGLTVPITGTADDIGPGAYWPKGDGSKRKIGRLACHFSHLELSKYNEKL